MDTDQPATLKGLRGARRTRIRRNELVEEIANAAQSCRVYYCNEAFSAADLQKIKACIDGLLPKKIDTSSWHAYAKQYRNEIAAAEEAAQ